MLKGLLQSENHLKVEKFKKKETIVKTVCKLRWILN